MNTMGVEVRKIIETITTTLEGVEFTEDRRDINLESEIATQDLMIALQAYELGEDPDSNKIADEAMFQKLITMISSRGEEILEWDNSYFVRPNTKANRLYTLVAKGIGECLGIDYLEILIPKTRGIDKNTSLDQYMIRKKEVIEGRKTFKQAILVKDAFLMFEKQMSAQRANSNFPAKSETDLIEEEIQVLSTHSEYATKYYKAIMSNNGITQARTEFQKAIEGDNYIVNASHLDRPSLIAAVMQKRKNEREFLSTLICQPTKEWRGFLKDITDPILFRCMLDYNDYDKVKSCFLTPQVMSNPQNAEQAKKKLAETIRSALKDKLNKMTVKLQALEKLSEVTVEDRYLFDPMYIRSCICAFLTVHAKIKELEPEVNNENISLVVNTSFKLFSKVRDIADFVGVPTMSTNSEKCTAADLLMNAILSESHLRGYVNSEAFKNERAFKDGILKLISDLLKIWVTHPHTLIEQGALRTLQSPSAKMY